MGTHISQIHLHDNRGETDEHLGLGRGMLIWTSCIMSVIGDFLTFFTGIDKEGIIPYNLGPPYRSIHPSLTEYRP
jgi:hypothetical protein